MSGFRWGGWGRMGFDGVSGVEWDWMGLNGVDEVE